jgi:hypothetical protein
MQRRPFSLSTSKVLSMSKSRAWGLKGRQREARIGLARLWPYYINIWRSYVISLSWCNEMLHLTTTRRIWQVFDGRQKFARLGGVSSRLSLEVNLAMIRLTASLYFWEISYGTEQARQRLAAGQQSTTRWSCPRQPFFFFQPDRLLA